MARKSKQTAEFGDFQTPDELSLRVMKLLDSLQVKAATILEPSCGKGSFLAAAAEVYPSAHLIGLEINSDYLQIAQNRLMSRPSVTLIQGSFFDQDWEKIIAELDGPILVTGNPPWVTNAELGTIGSENLPIKSNFQKLNGLDALTGKSNFDISEWMLIQNIKWLSQHGGVLAVLCKTSVARKIIATALKQEISFSDARIYRINALESFGAAVDACLFYLKMNNQPAIQHCDIYESLESISLAKRFGFINGRLISNIDNYYHYHALHGINKKYTWRSGVKHDCSKVMEFDFVDGAFINGYGEHIDIEDTYLYPLIKSSDISGMRHQSRKKFVLVTQKSVGSDTKFIEYHAPRTWSYLHRYSADLDRRGSVIYKDKPRFSIFGIGEYTFAPWKIAISGLYKNLNFQLYGSDNSKPIVFDDTVNFLSFQHQVAAQIVFEMLQSDEAQNYLEAMIFWDEKRPITVDILKRMDLEKLAQLLGRYKELNSFPSFLGQRKNQLSLLDKNAARSMHLLPVMG